MNTRLSFFRRRPRPAGASAAFTLLEILLASLAAALVLSAVYGIFRQAVRVRDSGTRRMHDVRLRARAETVLRNDLQNALVSGGTLAATLAGDAAGNDTSNLTRASGVAASGSFPGYLKFTTTTGRDTTAELAADVQLVEYFIADDPAKGNAAEPATGGMLIRSTTRDLLDTANLGGAAATTTHEEQILGGVQSFQVAFYDGTTWQPSWQFAGFTTDTGNGAAATPTPTPNATATTATGQPVLPQAVRVTIQQAPATTRDAPPPPLEVLVPWPTQPFAAATPNDTGGSSLENSGSPTPSPTPGGSNGPDGPNGPGTPGGGPGGPGGPGNPGGPPPGRPPGGGGGGARPPR